MKLEISPREKLMLTSCLNERLSELADDQNFINLKSLDYADLAEKGGSQFVAHTAKHLDTVNRLLVKLGYKKNPVIYEDVFQKIKNLKQCKECLLIGRADDYYKIALIDKDLRVATIELKQGVELKGEFAIHWVQRDRTWLEKEISDSITQRLPTKDALKAIRACKYKGTGLDKKMMRFLKVILG